MSLSLSLSLSYKHSKEAQKYLNPKDDHTPSDPPTNGEPGRPRRNSTTSTFGKILHAASSYGEYRECPNFVSVYLCVESV